MMHAKDFTRAPGTRFRLDRIDPADTGPITSKSAAVKPTVANLERLRELHEQLYADGSKGLLIMRAGPPAL